MNHKEALHLVLDLIQAVRNFDRHIDKYNREEYEDARQRVIDALVSPADREGK